MNDLTYTGSRGEGEGPGPHPVVTRGADGRPVASSRDVAAYFGKQHKHVLDAIDTLISEASACGPNFRLTSEAVAMPRGGTRAERCYLMDRDGFTLLAMGFTGAKALQFKLAYIGMFNAMEAELAVRPAVDPMQVLADPAAMRGLLLTYTEKVLALEAKVEEQGAKVKQLDRLAAAEGSMCLRDAAKTLNTRPKDLIASLSARRWIYKRPGNSSWIAYQDKIQAGYMEHIDHPFFDDQGRERIATRAHVTAKGLVRLAELLNAPLH